MSLNAPPEAVIDVFRTTQHTLKQAQERNGEKNRRSRSKLLEKELLILGIGDETQGIKRSVRS